MKYSVVILSFTLLSFLANAAIDVSFESGIPDTWTVSRGALKSSDFHYKDGSKSLQWDWQAGEELVVGDLQSQGLVPSEVHGYFENTFRMWVYNTTKSENDSVIISFLDENGLVQYHYHFYLNFNGWRSVAISYLYEMFGDKASQNLHTMKIQAPSNGEGTLFLDYVDFTTGRISSSAASTHIPYKRSIGDNHWSRMLYYSNLPKLYGTISPSQSELDDLHILKEEIDNYLKGSAPSSSMMSSANSAFNQLNISENSDGTIKGQPIFGGDGNDSENITILNDVILSFARDFVHNNSQESRNKFMQLVRHAHDQGYHYGSVLETVHHIGYDFRQYPLAVLIMEEELKKEGLWEDAYAMVCWFVGLDGIWESTADASNMDDANTRTIARYAACFYKATEAERVQYLKGFRDYIQHWAVPKPQLGEGVKTDYTGFHHNFYYPHRYVNPAYKSLSWVCEKFNKTSFDVSNEAKDVLKKCLLVSRLNSGGQDLPISLAGRGPVLSNIGSAMDGMKSLAYAYTPLDTQLIEALNRVNPDNRIAGYGREDYPNGFWQLNYAPMGVYRESSWVANIKGFNNNFTGTEIYSGENQYGRYGSYGALEVIYAGGNTESGKNTNGWNWNVLSGTTTIHLPLEQLYADGRRDERTDSEFAGALRFGKKEDYYLKDEYLIEGNLGVFGMNFQQKDLGPNHNPTFTFQKSVFCVDGLMICLGSGISNNDAQHITATNLFQNYLNSTDDRIILNNTSINLFPSARSENISEKNHWLVDAVGTGYMLKKGEGTLRITRTEQTSKDHSGRSTTKGNFATAYIDHGKAPSNATYEFVVIPGASAGDMRALADTLSRTYSVLEKSSSAHIIHYKDMEAGAFFARNSDLDMGIIRGNSQECLIVIKEEGDVLHCSVNKPSLVFDEEGLAKAETIRISLNGFYELKEGDSVSFVTYEDKSTVFDVQVKNGEPNDFILSVSPRSSVAIPTIHDAYLSSGTSYNNSSLRLVAGERDAYLMFDLSGITDSITQASLRLQYSGASTNGSLVLALASHSNWEEDKLDGENKPEARVFLDTLETQFSNSTVYTWKVPVSVLQDQKRISFILFPQDDTQATFASKESRIENVLIPSLDLITVNKHVTALHDIVFKAESNISVYPNPVSDALHVMTRLPGQLTVYSLNGEKVFSYSLTANTPYIIDEIGDLSKGIYVLNYVTRKHAETHKLLKL